MVVEKGLVIKIIKELDVVLVVNIDLVDLQDLDFEIDVLVNEMVYVYVEGLGFFVLGEFVVVGLIEVG